MTISRTLLLTLALSVADVSLALMEWKCESFIDLYGLHVNARSNLDTPPVLRENPRLVQHPEEYDMVGKPPVFADEKFPPLADGVYLFVIMRAPEGTEYALYSDRLPKRDLQLSDRFLATHRGLLRSVADRRSRDGQPGDEPISGGEFRIIRGRVSEVNNQCNTLLPTKEHLLFSRAWLAGRGLPIERTTRNMDLSTGGPVQSDHEAALKIVRRQVLFDRSNHPDLADVRDEALKLVREVYAVFPEGTRFAGAFDADGFIGTALTLPEAERNPVFVEVVLEPVGRFLEFAEHEGVEFAIDVKFSDGHLATRIAAGEKARAVEMMKAGLARARKLADEIIAKKQGR